jgi:hypothetical protein
MKRLAVTIAVLGCAIPLAAFAADTKASRVKQDAVEHHETEALNRLEAAGYHDFSDVTPAGSRYHATVTKDGQQATVLVEPDTGVITPVR